MAGVLITGATGNVGLEVIRALEPLPHSYRVLAGVRNVEKDKTALAGYRVTPVPFDFTDKRTYWQALEGSDLLFLLRPPQLSDVNKYFRPLIDQAVRAGVKHIVFLSVQGVESSSVIPHHKIEKLIVASKIPYTFLRPAYFMQNFTTTLRNDLVQNRLIFLPAGSAKFTLVDVEDIGKVAAQVIRNPAAHANRAYDLTCYEKLGFPEMADRLSRGLGTTIRYESPNLLKFFLRKRREGIAPAFILVMILLHFLPRFQKEPVITDWIEKITGEKPRGFDLFIQENKARLL
ncbi:NmrA family NAD(P)-binding protein [Larkinella soli]|uniref:NmrA family NAD(P)-binding protein n=1 Tax=Larkinella soli TaxID=1770527 RepID=UPI000FFBC6D8|nr:NmrA family NAD(P)-binding protein [Larkinella soli]